MEGEGRMKEGKQGGGQYYCHKCKATHNDLSGIGKAHIKYASKGIRRDNFLKYGVR